VKEKKGHGGRYRGPIKRFFQENQQLIIKKTAFKEKKDSLLLLLLAAVEQENKVPSHISQLYCFPHYKATIFPLSLIDYNSHLK
jgi:hypothetical protein